MERETRKNGRKEAMKRRRRSQDQTDESRKASIKGRKANNWKVKKAFQDERKDRNEGRKEEKKDGR